MKPRIDIYSHYFKVTNFSDLHEKLLHKFAWNRFTEKESVKLPYGQGWQENVISTYYVRPVHRREYRFHINALNMFYMDMSELGMHESFFEVVRHSIPVPTKIHFKLTDIRVPREDQKTVIDYVLSDGKSKMIRLQTGFGKTYIHNQAIAEDGKRVCLIVKPMYIERWKDDIKESFGDGVRVRAVSGSLQMMALLDEAKSGTLQDDFIIISNATYRNYLTDYVIQPVLKFNYCVEPDDFFEVIGAGWRSIDEVHQDFNFNFKCDLFTNVEKVLSLSATMVTRNKFLLNMYQIAYPENERSPEMEHDKYIQAEALFYQLQQPGRIKHKQKGRKSYSHSVFEASIMKDGKILRNYVNMFIDLTKRYYESIRREPEEDKPNMKLLLFFNRTEMCTIMTDAFRQAFPLFHVERLISGDDKEVLKKADIIISTLKSCGTAVDIKGLVRVIMSDAVDSIQANEQAVGRLRKIDKLWPDITPTFIYMVCQDIATHHRYHRNKMYSLRGKILGLNSVQTHYLI